MRGLEVFWPFTWNQIIKSRIEIYKKKKKKTDHISDIWKRCRDRKNDQCDRSISTRGRAISK